MTLLTLAPLRRATLSPARDAGDAAATRALAEAAPAGADSLDEARACGWFDSSWELSQGLAVDELPEMDVTVAALWFAELATPAAGSVWLQ
jgi:hypothetical protein